VVGIFVEGVVFEKDKLIAGIARAWAKSESDVLPGVASNSLSLPMRMPEVDKRDGEATPPPGAPSSPAQDERTMREVKELENLFQAFADKHDLRYRWNLNEPLTRKRALPIGDRWNLDEPLTPGIIFPESKKQFSIITFPPIDPSYPSLCVTDREGVAAVCGRSSPWGCTVTTIDKEYVMYIPDAGRREQRAREEGLRLEGQIRAHEFTALVHEDAHATKGSFEYQANLDGFVFKFKNEQGREPTAEEMEAMRLQTLRHVFMNYTYRQFVVGLLEQANGVVDEKFLSFIRGKDFRESIFTERVSGYVLTEIEEGRRGDLTRDDLKTLSRGEVPANGRNLLRQQVWDAGLQYYTRYHARLYGFEGEFVPREITALTQPLIRADLSRLFEAVFDEPAPETRPSLPRNFGK
jgi:hypothetical protein